MSEELTPSEGARSRGARALAATGALAAGLAVALGAFGTHVLEARIGSQALETFEVGVRYHLLHAIGMLLAAWAADRWPDRVRLWPGWLLGVGIVLFSGSLYGLALLGWTWLGPVTPLGGIAFLGAWGGLGWGLLRA